MMESLFGIDWRRTGPRELVREQRERFRALEGWQQLAIAGAVAVVVLYIRPSPPAWVWLFVLSAAVGSAAALVPSRRVIEELVTDDFELLEELDPVDGDRATRKLSRDRFQDMTVVDYAGKERDKSYLVEVSRLVDVNENGEGEYRKAFEIDRYYPERNLAVASYMAGASNADLRRYERAVWEIKSELSKEADKSLEEIVQAPEARRRAAGAAVQQMIEAAEGIEAPGSHSMIDELDQLRREAEQSVDDLLADRGISDLEERVTDEDDQQSPDAVEISIGGNATDENGGDDE